MSNSSLTLFFEINMTNLIFYVGENNDQKNVKINYKLVLPIDGIENKGISDFEKIYDIIKKNILLIEKKFNHTFRQVVIILENFNPTFINLTGFKKMNGSQLLRENVTYIINDLKSYLNKTETNKKILHIFNSKFCLDNKKINNLPIGLFGDFYSHELSFILISTSDYKNLENVFEKCNLKIEKILLKSFVNGVHTIENTKNIETFFQIKIDKNNSKIFYFENDSLKFDQDFEFGWDIIISDISKITSLKKETVKHILNEIELRKQISDNEKEELIGKEYFKSENYIKIKKKLIFEIMLARVQEILEIMIIKNTNLSYYNKNTKNIFLELESEFKTKNIEEAFIHIFSTANSMDLKLVKCIPSDEMLNTVNKLVHFGWKKEAIPVTHTKKTKIARFFDAIFS